MGCLIFKIRKGDEAREHWEKIQQQHMQKLINSENSIQEKGDEQIIFSIAPKLNQKQTSKHQVQQQKEMITIQQQDNIKIKQLDTIHLFSLSIVPTSKKQAKKLGISFQQINEQIMPFNKAKVTQKIQEFQEQVDVNKQEFVIQQKEVSQVNNNYIIQNNQQQELQKNNIQLEIQQNNYQQEIQQNILKQEIQQTNAQEKIKENNAQQNIQQTNSIQEIQQNNSSNFIQENNSHQNVQDEIQQQMQDESNVHQNEENILKRCFMINMKELKIGKLYDRFLTQFKTITSEIILDQIIYKMVTANQLMYSQRVTWLIQSLVNLSECEIQASNANFYDGSISKEVLMKLINAILDKLVSAVAKPQKLEWQADREDLNKYTSEENQIASQVYDMLFGQQIKINLDISFEDLEHPALNYLLTYLDTKCQTQDALRFIDLITKRELYKCQKVDLTDCVNQQRALLLLNKLSFYPKITELLLENSWAFGKFQQFKNGRDLQIHSIFGSIVCLSTFPRDFPQVISIFGNQEKSLSILKECYRGPIYEIINKMADIFLRIIRRGKQAQLQLYTYICKLIEINLNLEKVTQKELFDKCCFQGMMFNLQQILLEIFNPFIYNIEQANAKVGKINRDLLANIKNHPFLSKIHQNVNQMAPLKTVFIPLDKQPDLDPMTVLYLLIQRIAGLQQHMMIDYVISYVFLQYDKKHFGANSKFTKESEIDKATYDSLLLHPKSIQNTIQFLSFQSKVALSLLDENYQPKYPYGLLSNQFMSDIINYCFVYNSNGVALDYLDEIISICEFTIITMKHQELNEDIHLRCKGMDLFYIFNDYVTQQDYNNAKKSFKIFSENKIIQNFLIDGLIQSYVDHDRVKVSHILPPFRFKKSICQLFTYILTTHNQIYEKKFLEYINQNSKTYQNFAFVYINDIKEMIDHCVEATKKIKAQEDTERNLPPTEQAILPLQEKFIKQFLNKIAEKKCLFDWQGVTELFKNVILFTKIEPKAFLIDETRQQFAQNLNYVLEQLNGKGNDYLNSKFLVNSDVKPKEISNNIIEIFVNLKDQSVFWDEIAMNNQSLQVQTLHQLVNKLSYQKAIPESQLQEFFQIIENLDLLRHDFDQIMNDLTKDSNKEQRYVDSLTRNLMTDPVMLPNSKQIVDRVTIKRYLIKKQEDPFDRSYLTAEMLIEQKELKLEIKQYIDSKKTEMRLQRQPFQNSFR